MANDMASHLRKLGRVPLLKVWRAYRLHVNRICQNLALEALMCARVAGSVKQSVESGLWQLQAKTEEVALQVEPTIGAASRADKEKGAAQVASAKAAALTDFRELCAHAGVELSGEQNAQLEALQTRFDQLHKRVLAATFYEEVSDVERISIMRAMLQQDIGSMSGHSYRERYCEDRLAEVRLLTYCVMCRLSRRLPERPHFLHCELAIRSNM